MEQLSTIIKVQFYSTLAVLSVTLFSSAGGTLFSSPQALKLIIFAVSISNFVTGLYTILLVTRTYKAFATLVAAFWIMCALVYTP